MPLLPIIYFHDKTEVGFLIYYLPRFCLRLHCRSVRNIEKGSLEYSIPEEYGGIQVT